MQNNEKNDKTQNINKQIEDEKNEDEKKELYGNNKINLDEKQEKNSIKNMTVPLNKHFADYENNDKTWNLFKYPLSKEIACHFGENEIDLKEQHILQQCEEYYNYIENVIEKFLKQTKKNINNIIGKQKLKLYNLIDDEILKIKKNKNVVLLELINFLNNLKQNINSNILKDKIDILINKINDININEINNDILNLIIKLLKNFKKDIIKTHNEQKIDIYINNLLSNISISSSFKDFIEENLKLQNLENKIIDKEIIDIVNHINSQGLDRIFKKHKLFQTPKKEDFYHINHLLDFLVKYHDLFNMNLNYENLNYPKFGLIAKKFFLKSVKKAIDKLNDSLSLSLEKNANGFLKNLRKEILKDFFAQLWIFYEYMQNMNLDVYKILHNSQNFNVYSTYTENWFDLTDLSVEEKFMSSKYRKIRIKDIPNYNAKEVQNSSYEKSISYINDIFINSNLDFEKIYTDLYFKEFKLDDETKNYILKNKLAVKKSFRITPKGLENMSKYYKLEKNFQKLKNKCYAYLYTAMNKANICYILDMVDYSDEQIKTNDITKKIGIYEEIREMLKDSKKTDNFEEKIESSIDMDEKIINKVEKNLKNIFKNKTKKSKQANIINYYVNDFSSLIMKIKKIKEKIEKKEKINIINNKIKTLKYSNKQKIEDIINNETEKNEKINKIENEIKTLTNIKEMKEKVKEEMLYELIKKAKEEMIAILKKQIEDVINNEAEKNNDEIENEINALTNIKEMKKEAKEEIIKNLFKKEFEKMINKIKKINYVKPTFGKNDWTSFKENYKKALEIYDEPLKNFFNILNIKLPEDKKSAKNNMMYKMFTGTNSSFYNLFLLSFFLFNNGKLTENDININYVNYINLYNNLHYINKHFDNITLKISELMKLNLTFPNLFRNLNSLEDNSINLKNDEDILKQTRDEYYDYIKIEKPE